MSVRWIVDAVGPLFALIRNSRLTYWRRKLPKDLHVPHKVRVMRFINISTNAHHPPGVLKQAGDVGVALA